MRFASLGSGSKGNGTLVSDGSVQILIDCGFSIRETESRLARLGVDASDIDAVVVTHEHTDHAKGVLPLARKHQIPIYMTGGTAAVVADRRGAEADVEIHVVRDGAAVGVGNITVTPVAVPHDAREPVQFVFSRNQLRLGVLTDLGKITPHVIEYFSDCDGLLLEANHDLDMLHRGPYPASLKRRVASDWGHLNNSQSLGMIGHLEPARVQQLVLGHISEQNNSVDLLRSQFEALETDLSPALFACQNEGFGWLSLD